jgi:hypothetical protein
LPDQTERHLDRADAADFVRLIGNEHSGDADHSRIGQKQRQLNLESYFIEETPEDVCVDIMWELNKNKVVSEKTAGKRFMFNVFPTSDIT